jgi:uncharacterized membrane protein YtjA (UPF0391 family)
MRRPDHRTRPGHARCTALLSCQSSEFDMLSWAIAFFIIAIVAAVFGFGGIAAGAAGIAKVLFFLFLIAFGVSLVVGLMGGRGPRV